MLRTGGDFCPEENGLESQAHRSIKHDEHSLAELSRLSSENLLDAENVVLAAKDPESPLHDYFEWDDSKAAHTYRLVQARRIIRTVQFEVTHSHVTIRAPIYVRDARKPRDETAAYLDVRTMKEDKPAVVAQVHWELSQVLSLVHRTIGVMAAFDLDCKPMVDVQKRIEGILAGYE